MSAPPPEPAALDPQQVAERADAVLAEVATAVVDMRSTLRIALAAILADGHVLFEDLPGLGKTLAARSLSTALGLQFRRVQCTPDLLPSDITGSAVWDPQATEFRFRPGPVFTGLLLADEINRTAPKTQSALLESMAERQVTVDGVTHPLPRPFHVVATSNPVEYEGTYPLPEAQLDRFMVRIAAGHPSVDAEVAILTRRLERRREEATVRQVVDAPALLAMQAGVEAVPVDPDVVRYCVALAGATRSHPAVEVGASPRGSQALLLVARALAVIDGRGFVTPEDVKEVAVATLAHRITLTPASWAGGMQPDEVVRQALTRVAGPAAVRRPVRG